jgi:hypothetical protein
MKHSGNTNQYEQNQMQGYGNQNRTNTAIHCLSHISPNTLRVCSRNHHKSVTSTRKTESFDPVTHEQHRLPPTSILTNFGTTKSQQKIGGGQELTGMLWWQIPRTTKILTLGNESDRERDRAEHHQNLSAARLEVMKAVQRKLGREKLRQSRTPVENKTESA